MGRKCLTCTHPKYREINRSLVAGRQPLAEISRQFGISTDALRNHQRRCLHTNLRRAQERRENDYAEELWGVFKKSLTRLNANITDLEDVISATKKRKHYGTLIKALGEVRATLELSYKLIASISATQTAEQDISLALHDERLPQVLQELSSDELRIFHAVISKIMDRTSIPMLEVGSGGVIDVSGGGAWSEDEGDLEADNLDVPLMVRTRFPRGDVGDLDSDNVDEMLAHEQAIPENVGGDGGGDGVAPIETAPPVNKWRPNVPPSLIHFEGGHLLHKHLMGRKRRGK